jgi:hypothetical protein
MDHSKSIVGLFYAGMSVPDISMKLGVPQSTIYYQLTKFKTTGTTNKMPGQGRKRSARSEANVAKVKARIKKDPFVSQRQLARELQIAEGSIRNLLKKDLNIKSRARVKKHLINQVSQDKRLQKSKKLLNLLKTKKPIILFSDEKVFDVDSVSNSRLDRYLSSEKSEDVQDNIRFKFQTKHPANVMVFGLVSSDGKKMAPHFFPVGTRIDSEKYIEVLKNKVKPWIRKTYGLGAEYVLMQDGAPCHTSKKTQKWLEDNNVKFWPKEIWPPNSPDLNPLDYSIWAYIARKACQRPHPNIESLSSAIKSAWRTMSPKYIRTTCSRFRTRLEEVVANEGGHIEG